MLFLGIQSDRLQKSALLEPCGVERPLSELRGGDELIWGLGDKGGGWGGPEREGGGFLI